MVLCDQRKWPSHQPKQDTIKMYTTKMEVSPMTMKKDGVLTNESKHIWKKIGVLRIRNDSSMEDKISPTKFGQSRNFGIYIYIYIYILLYIYICDRDNIVVYSPAWEDEPSVFAIFPFLLVNLSMFWDDPNWVRSPWNSTKAMWEFLVVSRCGGCGFEAVVVGKSLDISGMTSWLVVWNIF